MKRRLAISIGLLSCSMVAFQVALMQILSISQWNHFAYMVISVAMLGFGASGTALAFLRNHLVPKIGSNLAFLMIFTSLSIMGILFFSRTVFGGFDSYLVFYEKRHYLNLICSYLMLFVPFFLGASALGLAYSHYASDIGRLYFADLAGSGMGGLLMLILLWHVSPSVVPFVIACLPLVAGLLIFRHNGKTVAEKTGLLTLALLALVLLVAGFLNPPILPSSQYKSLSRALLLPDARVVETINSPYGQLKRVSAPALRYAPGLSLGYTGQVPVTEVLFHNGDWLGPLVPMALPEREETVVLSALPGTPDAEGAQESLDGKETGHYLDYSTQALPYVIGTPGKVFVADAATGLQAGYALSRGAKEIVAVEPNSTVVGMVTRNIAVPGEQISFIAGHSRYHVQQDDRYDLILLPETGSFGGSSGILALEEQYLFTLDAFSLLWDRLSPGGMIAATLWVDYPPRSTFKLLATMAVTAESKGVEDPADHIVAVRSWSTITCVLVKNKVSANNIDKIRTFCQSRQFDPLLYPGIHPEEREVYNMLQDKSFFRTTDLLLTREREKLFREYDFQIRPATDSRPYFSQFLKLGRLSKMREVFGSASMPFLEVGYLIVLLTMAQIFLASFLFIVLPLIFKKVPGKGKTSLLVFFSFIGIGYMFAEMVFIQQFTLFFGSPLYAASAVLSAMLFFSGTGSACSQKMVTGSPRLRLVAGVIAVLLALLALFLPSLMKATIGNPLPVKVLLCALVIGPPAFLMGMMFPSAILAIRHVGDGSLIPWAWAVNGSFSVISTALAAVISVEAGYQTVMWVAVAAYLMAGISTRFRLFSIFVK
ncbi:MAG TPA: hypothetical protein PLR34_06040 [Bacteroidales bacterium]|jgi:hypothetical protein|nr:hypothetical protein [Bacteroidales bacterium]OQC57317.1 MAG: hypothetical protein BWX52_01115 [Bacteroidetes bacterium ADurb.Bin013]MBV6455869.1 hypothetical protein [Bacteroidales bacterium]NLZ08711.1 hypothetical protein [Bacteroidales bacterium]HNR28555.1 hypothetical protein [Bacteroidales bacterium]